MEHETFNLKILYAEDDAATRREMENFLKRKFSRVILAGSGREGLEKFAQYGPDIVIADLIMEDMSGIEMVERIRGMGADCPVMIVSALEDTRSILRSVDLGIVKYVIKPVNTEELSAALDRVAEKLYSGKSPFLRMDISRKKEIETEIRSGFTALLKKASGKGPRIADVFIGENRVELSAEGILTPLEETLLSVPGNRVIVEQNRKLFHAAIQAELEGMLGTFLASRVALAGTRFDSLGGREEYLFKYSD